MLLPYFMMRNMENKRHTRKWVALAVLVLVALSSCLKEGDDTSILLNDPQDIPLITEYLPEDLLEMFGEKNIYFGDQPPVVDMEFVSNHEYVAIVMDGPNHPQVGGVSANLHYHKLYNHYLQIADYYSMTSDELAFEEYPCKIISPVYITGSGNDFSVYYYEESQTFGLPVYAVVMSGTVTSGGIKNYRYGYKIMQYNDTINFDPLAHYPLNSIFIFKDHDGLAEKEAWFDESLLEP